MKKILSATGLVALSMVWCAFLWTAAGGADIVYFKDGMRTMCHGKAWEEKEEVHCEYDGGLLIYSKHDVARIEKGPAIHVGAESPVPPDRGSAPAAAPPPPAKSVSEPPPQPSSGVLFYDPRRTKKYWSSPTVQHDTYQQALSALASEFERPVPWIEENLGDSNDLDEIRANLVSRKQNASPVPAAPAVDAAAGAIEFYNPRRPQKYWTAPDARHNTYEEAVEAFAREFGQTASWVDRHLGESNSVDLIRQSLRNAQLAEKGN